MAIATSDLALFADCTELSFLGRAGLNGARKSGLKEELLSQKCGRVSRDTCWLCLEADQATEKECG
jgi:hypothetical protein